MGWFALAILGVAVGAGLWLTGLPRGLAYFTGAAIALGAAGYAWQGRPLLGATPVAADTQGLEVDPGMIAFRSTVFPTAVAPEFARADAALRRGVPQDAVAAMLDAVRARPKDAAAWTALGNAYVANDAGQMSPAARFAFSRALKLAPTEAGPPFFLGMGLAAGGDFAGARDAWQLALARTPAKAPYREDIELRLGMVDVMIKRGMAPQ